MGNKFTAQDRCDSCGAQAYGRVTLFSGGELLYCMHHCRRFEERLIVLGKLDVDVEGYEELAVAR